MEGTGRRQLLTHVTAMIGPRVPEMRGPIFFPAGQRLCRRAPNSVEARRN